MTEPRLAARDLRQVVGILKTWREIKYQLHFRQDDAIFGGYGSDFEARSRGGRPGNPTQNRAIRLATDPETLQYKHMDDVLERALLDVAGPAGKRAPAWAALRMHYLGNNKWESVAKSFGVTRQTLFRWGWDKEFKASILERLRGVK